MRRRQKNTALVIGVGNQYRHDDGAGLVVAQRLRQHPPANTVIRTESGEGAALMEAWQEAVMVILVDAVQSGSRVGTIHRLDAGRRRIPSRFFHYSTHAFSVAEAVELARALKQLPPRLIIYGIEGKIFQSGEGLSPEVESAVEKVVLRIDKELNTIRKQTRR